MRNANSYLDFKISLDSKLAKITGWKENSIRHLK